MEADVAIRGMTGGRHTRAARSRTAPCRAARSRRARSHRRRRRTDRTASGRRPACGRRSRAHRPRGRVAPGRGRRGTPRRAGGRSPGRTRSARRSRHWVGPGERGVVGHVRERLAVANERIAGGARWGRGPVREREILVVARCARLGLVRRQPHVHLLSGRGLEIDLGAAAAGRDRHRQPATPAPGQPPAPRVSAAGPAQPSAQSPVAKSRPASRPATRASRSRTTVSAPSSRPSSSTAAWARGARSRVPRRRARGGAQPRARQGPCGRPDASGAQCEGNPARCQGCLRPTMG